MYAYPPLNIRTCSTKPFSRYIILFDLLVSDEAVSKFHLPTMFQTSDIDLPFQIQKKVCYTIQNHSSITPFIICVYKCPMPGLLKLHIHFTKSPKRDNICLLHCTKSKKRDDIKIFVYRWKMNTNTEFYLPDVTLS